MRRNKTEDLADILDMLEATWFRTSGERERANGKNGRGKRLNERDVDEMMREIRTSLEENDGFPNDFDTDFDAAAPQALPADEERNALEEGFFKFRERFPVVSIVVAPPRLETVDTVDGEKRRLAVAGVLAMDCDILIFDEPFANLDWPGVKQVCSIITRLKKEGKTLIVLTHELEKVLSLADRFLILHYGKIYFDGDPEEGLQLDLNKWGIRNPLVSYTSIEDLIW